MTLNDLELQYILIFSEFRVILQIWKPTTAKQMKIDPRCQLVSYKKKHKIVALRLLFSDVSILNSNRLRWYCWAFFR